MKIRGKLLSMVVPLVVLTVLTVGCYAYLMTSNYNNSKTLYFTKLYGCNSTLINADRDFYQASSALFEYLNDKNKELINDYNENIGQTIERVGEVRKTVDAYPDLQHYENDGKTFNAEFDAFDKSIKALQEAYDIETGKGDIAAYETIFNETREHISNMEDLMEAYAVENEASFSKRIKGIIISTLIFNVIIVIGVNIYSFQLISKIQNALVRLTGKLTAMSKKDLTAPIEIVSGKDEISQLSVAAFNLRKQLLTMMETFQSSSGSLADASENMENNTKNSVEAVQNIDRAANELANTASVQAGDVSNIVSEIMEISAISNESINNTNSLADACENIENVTETGMETVRNLSNITNQSNEAFNNIFDAIKTIEEKTEVIGTASGMIADIASQTNLLSLNASIEAARAGEAGRGFAVVADEIRKLAEQSASSVETINSMIEELSTSSDNATRQSTLVKKYVEEQLKSVQDTKAGFEAIVSNVGTVNNGVENLRGINGNLDQKVKHMTDVMESLSAISEENAATSEELSATTSSVMANVGDLETAGETVKSLAEQLKDIVLEYKLEA